MSLKPSSFEAALASYRPLKRSPMKSSRKPLKTRQGSKSRKKRRPKAPSTARIQAKFNLMVKERGNWICVKCKKDFSENRRLLQCSHFWGVGFTATRFDFDNCDPLCYPCHYGQMRTGWEYNKQGEYRTYMIKKLGQEGYDALEQKARSFMKLLDAKLDFIEYVNTINAPTTDK